MKGYLFFILSFISIASFGQSDLEITDFYFGAPGANLSKGEEIIWMFKAKNIGSSRASVLEYKIWFSEDDKIDEANDQLLKQGKISEDWSKLIGLKAGGEIKKSDLFIGRIRVPLDVEVNKGYYFILSIEKDINKNETNFENNIVKQKLQIGIRDKLQIFPVSFNNQKIPNLTCNYSDEELGDRTPLLLIHGWQPIGRNAEGNTGVWNNFLRYYACDSDLQNKFKVYYVKYFSNEVSVDDLGHELRLDLDNTFTEFHNRKITIMAHSMGGLVSRSFIKRTRNEGVFLGKKGGERVNKLITLGTPHHGSPMANGEIRKDISVLDDLLLDLLLKKDFNIEKVLEDLDNLLFGIDAFSGSLIPPSKKFNRWDLRWDNYDNYYDYSNYFNSQNFWLNSNKMNGDASNYFDDKIIAYAGGLFKNRSYSSILKKPINIGYFSAEKFLKNFGFVNDGIVPFLSATFQGHKLHKVRAFRGYYHDEIAKGRFDLLDENGLDKTLFNSIKLDLLDKPLKSRIEVTLKDELFLTTALDSTSSKKITLSVLGDNNVSIDSIELVGAQKNEFNFDPITFPIEIEQGKDTIFNLNFIPKSIGEKSIIFRINNSSINKPQLDISLKGLAVETAKTDYSTNIDKNFDFGDVYIYGETKLLYSSVSNSSSAPYTVDSLHIKGTDSGLFKIVQQPKFPRDFEPGDSEPIVLSFDPNTVGEKNAIIQAHFKGDSILDSAILVGNGIITYSDPNASKLSLYEYWFNDDYLGKKSVNLTRENSEESLIYNSKTDDIKQGLNILHFRIKDEKNQWSSILSEYVYVQNSTSTGEDAITYYEYWFGSDYSSKISGNTNSSTNSYILELNDNITSIGTGMHQFHIRFKDSKGNWSSVSSEFIYNTKTINFGENKINEYRYWFNDDFENKVSKPVVDSESLFFLNKDINISNLVNNSLNYIHIQFKDNSGSWSSVLTEEFLYETTLGSENFSVEKFNLYPNPANSKVYLSTKISTGQLFVFDTLGKLIKKFSTIPTYVDISYFKSGLYIFKIKSENITYQVKIIKF